MRVELDSKRVWLVGGGLTKPWSYAELAAGSESRPIQEPARGVAEVLIRLTHALRSGDEIEMADAGFAGEGAPPTVDVAQMGGLTELVLRGATLVRLRTSGSTGSATAVTHRAADLWRSVRVGEEHRDDVWGLAFNPTHIAGVQVFLQALGNGNTMVNLWGLSRAEIVQRCSLWKVTHLSATPTFYRLLLPLDDKLPAVQSISLGGEQANEGLMAKLRSTFPGAKVRNIYASTEAGSLFVAKEAEFEVPTTLAALVKCAEGRLWLHRSLLGAGSFQAEWHDTGDVVEVTSSTPLRFRIVGRAAGWINVGGEKVNPAEVEDIVLSHPDVAAARVHGRKNSVTGNILAVDVVAGAAELTQQALSDYLEERLPPHKRPRIIKFVDTLELTRTGKLVRND